MKNRFLLGAGVALAMAFGGVEAQAQFFGQYPPGAFYFGPEGGWTHLTKSKSQYHDPRPFGNYRRQPGKSANQLQRRL